MTKLVHGEEEAKKAKSAAEALFSNGGNMDNVPTITVTDDLLGTKLLDLLAERKVIATKSEGRRLMQQNGLSIDDVKITDVETQVTPELFAGKDSVLLRKGKKNTTDSKESRSQYIKSETGSAWCTSVNLCKKAAAASLPVGPKNAAGAKPGTRPAFAAWSGIIR